MSDAPEAPPPSAGSRRAGRVVAIVLGLIAVVWACFLFFGLPFVYGKKVEALVGQPRAVVDEQLGAPTREWTAGEFACDPTFKCDASKAKGGPVLLYADRTTTQAWYLYFDSAGTLGAVQRSVSPDYDGGVPP